MIQAAFLRAQETSGVLATVAIPLTNGPCAELRTFLRDFGKVHRHNNRGHADNASRRMYGIILRPDRQRNPFVPGHGTKVLCLAIIVQFDIERRRHIRGHLAKDFLRRTNIDRLPVAIEHQHGVLVQYVHKFYALPSLSSTDGHSGRPRTTCFGAAAFPPAFAESEGWCLFFVEMKLVASPGIAPGHPASKAGALLIMQRGLCLVVCQFCLSSLRWLAEPTLRSADGRPSLL